MGGPSGRRRFLGFGLQTGVLHAGFVKRARVHGASAQAAFGAGNLLSKLESVASGVKTYPA